MKVRYSTRSTRAQNPIFVFVSESKGKPEIKVVDTQSDQAFRVNVSHDPLSREYQANFWVETSGTYQVVVKDLETQSAELVHVEPQRFLSFFEEYGLFNFMFIPLFAFIFWWARGLKKDRYEVKN